MTLTRRAWLALAGAVPALAGCAGGFAPATNRILDVASGRPATVTDLMARVRASDVVLLGELHDNPHHHARRADLLRRLPATTPVVLEHLPRGVVPQLPRTPHDADAGMLLRALEAAGFDARGWRWPLHEPLFAALAANGHALRGGNVPRELLQRAMREGDEALPQALRSIVEAAPLQAAARQVLERDLQRGHCGALPPRLLPAMVLAQRARDAAMAEALVEALTEPQQPGAGARPVVLLAGNGHVRRDYGVPQVLAAIRPGARVLCVAYDEPARGEPASEPAPTDFVWTTPAATRTDPCAAMPRIGSAGT